MQLSGFNRISDYYFFNFFLHSWIRMENLNILATSRHAHESCSLALSPGYPLKVKLICGCFHGRVHVPMLCLLRQIMQHHYETLILCLAVLDFLILWVESH